uniref:Uncharacterized protein n=1 Tax=Neobacillus citreus TaxID=2833578 RepID=A0A942YD62_9BACI
MPRRLDVPDYATDPRASVYLVRLWFAPSDPAAAWPMDDWILDDVAAVEDALAWAVSQGATSFEMFVRTHEQQDWIRLHGEPGDGREIVTEVLLESDG